MHNRSLRRLGLTGLAVLVPAAGVALIACSVGPPASGQPGPRQPPPPLSGGLPRAAPPAPRPPPGPPASPRRRPAGPPGPADRPRRVGRRRPRHPAHGGPTV